MYSKSHSDSNRPFKSSLLVNDPVRPAREIIIKLHESLCTKLVLHPFRSVNFALIYGKWARPKSRDSLNTSCTGRTQEDREHSGIKTYIFIFFPNYSPICNLMDCLDRIHIHNSGSVLPTLITGTTFTVTCTNNQPT